MSSRLPGRRRLGVGLAMRGEEMSVSQVVEGSEAERAGLKVGDILIRIDGEVVTQERIGKALDVRGLMNIQFMVQGGQIYVLEVNPRASRTVPFVAKAIGDPLASIAARMNSISGEYQKPL